MPGHCFAQRSDAVQPPRIFRNPVFEIRDFNQLSNIRDLNFSFLNADNCEIRFACTVFIIFILVSSQHPITRSRRQSNRILPIKRTWNVALLHISQNTTSTVENAFALFAVQLFEKISVVIIVAPVRSDNNADFTGPDIFCFSLSTFS